MTGRDDGQPVRLREIAYSRSGDKADISNIVVIPYDDDDWDFLCERLTTEVVAKAFEGLVHGSVTRYELPGIRALNFVMQEALSGGVASSLRVDRHGKSYQSLLLDVDL